MPISTLFESSGNGDIAPSAAGSPLIESLFPPGVVAAELSGPGSPALLKPEEAVSVARAARGRVEEFAAGRLCARYALERFGITGFALRAAPDRQPIWPDTLVGSITHTGGFCAAVIGRRKEFRGLGLDTERAGAVNPGLRRSIGTAAELRWVESLPRGMRGDAATLIFSAKEAFYKSQYPLTGEYLSFADVQVAVSDWGDAQGSFSIAPTRRLALFSTLPACTTAAHALVGRYRFHQAFVSAGVFLASPQSNVPVCR